jgi:hypothetical protein
MTITLNNSFPVQQAGNGSWVTVAYPWKISAASDLVIGFIVGGIYTQQTSGYTVSGVGLNTGGNITFATAPPLGTTVDIRTLTPEIQGTEFANLAAYLPENSTNASDRLVRMVQDLTRLTYTFGIHGPDQENVAWPALPTASTRANTALVFDQNGLPGVGVLTSTTLTQPLFNAFLQNAPTPTNTLSLGTPSLSYANAYLGPNAVPVFDANTGNIGYVARTAAEVSASIVPTDYFYPPGDVRRYGCDITGATDCTTAVNTALKVYSSVVLPPGTYLIDGSANSGVITLPPASALGAVLGSVFFKITANSGLTDVTHSPFVLQSENQVYGLIINYPNQVVADLQADILQYPPTFTINPTNNASYGVECYIRHIICTRSYIFCSVQGAFADCLWENIVCSINLYRGLDFSGANVNMQDTSRVLNCQFEMAGPLGFNAGPIVQYIQANSIGISATTQGSNRIDGLMVVNSNVVGGSIGIFAGVAVWIQAVNVGLDSVAQAILVSGVASQFYGDEIWCSLQQQNYGLRQIPGIRCNNGILRLTNAEISMQTGGAQCAVFIDSGLVELGDVRFFTSRGGFGPAIYNSTGVVKASGCTVSSSNSVSPSRPLAWQDCVIGTSGFGNDTVTFSIDGKSGPIHWQGVLSPSNFNMATWSGGVPSDWSTSAGVPGNYFSNLQPVDGNTGIQIAGTSSGAFTLSYPLSAAFDDLYGYYLFQCAIEIIDPGSAPGNGFEILLTDNSGSFVYSVPISWAGSNTEPLGIPAGSYYPLSVLLCAPAGTALGKIVLSFNNTTSSVLTIRMKSITLWGMATPPECSGIEYWGGQTAGKPRDVSRGSTRLLLRGAAPTAGIWQLQDTALNNASPSSGTTEWRCTAAGSPGTWTGLTIP